MRRLALSFLLGLACFAYSFANPTYAAASLSGLLTQPGAKASRFTFILNQKTQGKVTFHTQPSRVIVEFAHTERRFPLSSIKWNKSNVTAMKTASEGGVLRFIFYVNTSVTWRVFYQETKANNEHGVRLHLDILSASGSEKSKKSTIKVISVAKAHANPVTPSLKSLKEKFQAEIMKKLNELAMPHKSSIFTVVIDPGHGGKDSGAVGKKGSLEKNIVLSIAKRLATKINQQANMRALLTRKGDYFVSLRDRLKFARKNKADIFIAIHADAYFNNTANGVSVFALSQHGATTEAARWLAHRENYSELGNVALNELSDRDPILRSVLVDLAQTVTIRDSIRLGNKMLAALDPISSLHYQKVERAPFVVLKSPDIPSILVEAGFVTNPKEEARLNDPGYQQKVADSLWQGINMYRRHFVATRGHRSMNL